MPRETESVTERLDERSEKWLDAFERMGQFVPLSQYDEVSKLAHYAFEEMMSEIRSLSEALERIAGMDAPIPTDEPNRVGYHNAGSCAEVARAALRADS